MTKRNSFRRVFLVCSVMFMLCMFPLRMAGAGQNDPWASLRDIVSGESPKDSAQAAKTEHVKKHKKQIPIPPVKPPDPNDPWAKLRAIYLPFSEQDEAAAQSNAAAGKKVSQGLHKAVAPYAALIKEASELFHVPREIIAAVIMVESGGKANAKAKTTSAAGLMQTIKSTFKMARTKLAKKGIHIANSPYAPRASIMAGSWYLGRMYDRAAADARTSLKNRNRITAWKYPLEYYYAGPTHGAKREDIVIIYADGKKIVVDKPGYSNKVLKWASIMQQST